MDLQIPLEKQSTFRQFAETNVRTPYIDIKKMEAAFNKK